MIATLARWWQRLYSPMADRKLREAGADLPPKTMADVKQADAHEALLEKHGGAKQGNGPIWPENLTFPRSCRLRLTDPSFPVSFLEDQSVNSARRRWPARLSRSDSRKAQ